MRKNKVEEKNNDREEKKSRRRKERRTCLEKKKNLMTDGARNLFIFKTFTLFPNQSVLHDICQEK